MGAVKITLTTSDTILLCENFAILNDTIEIIIPKSLYHLSSLLYRSRQLKSKLEITSNYYYMTIDSNIIKSIDYNIDENRD